jgi:hypothetical protein
MQNVARLASQKKRENKKLLLPFQIANCSYFVYTYISLIHLIKTPCQSGADHEPLRENCI